MPRPALISQTEYAKRLRPLLPAEAFQTDPHKLVILGLNFGIFLAGILTARHLSTWPPAALPLFFPIALLMANSVTVFLFSCHDLMHNSVVKQLPRLTYWVSFFGLALWWMPPTQWRSLHNKVHHRNTNNINDPDRNYLHQQPKTWGSWIHNLVAPSSEANPIWLMVGMGTAWGVHNFRNLTSVLFFPNSDADYVPAAFAISQGDRRKIAGELILITLLHLGLILFLGLEFWNLALGYFLPIALGHALGMFYIYTNHLICPMTPVNDPLINSVSLKVPAIFDCLHLNFSYHTEHHIFPGLNSDYYPQVQALLLEHYPERFNLISAKQAWHLLLSTPRHYRSDWELTSYTGEQNMACPLPAPSTR